MIDSACKVAIAGASGFVGRALAASLSAKCSVVGLGRNVPKDPGRDCSEWRKVDFLSLLEAERALKGIDVAFYLIHSMMPSAHLTQGKFQDFDLIAADNFARSARDNGVKQIIYLGGLIPEGEELSTHLSSRMEVGEQLAAYGTPVTTLRAGMIVGKGGSSFVMVKRLVERLPVMLCPHWTRVKSQPIALKDVVALLVYCCQRKETYGESYDVGGPDVVTYEDVMREIGNVIGRRPILFRSPFFTPKLSRLWVSLVTGAPKALVKPLIQSLRHEMIAQERRLQEAAGIPGTPFRELVRETIAAEQITAREEPVAFLGSRRGKPDLDVSSVQRRALPAGLTADDLAKEYLYWLPRLFFFVVRVKVDKSADCRFELWPLRKPLLVLHYAKQRSTSDRALFYIRGGSLAKIQGRGRLEFREVLGRKFLLTSVLGFRPRMPWFIYKVTQAPLHLLVMHAFGRHLKSAERRGFWLFRKQKQFNP